MTSTFENNMAAANAKILTEFGETVTYTPKGGEGQSITATLSPPNTDIQDDDMGEAEIRFRTITVPLADVAAPAIGDTITAGGEMWVVTAINNISSGVAELQCRNSDELSRRHETHKNKLPVR